MMHPDVEKLNQEKEVLMVKIRKQMDRNWEKFLSRKQSTS